MSLEQHFDWREVVGLQPKGYMETQEAVSGRIIHGPVESVSIDEDDFVHIKLKWAAETWAIGYPGFGGFKNSPDDIELIFPNLIVPFVFDDTPNKGRRVRFAVLNILYLQPVEGIDPSKVEGLHIKPA